MGGHGGGQMGMGGHGGGYTTTTTTTTYTTNSGYGGNKVKTTHTKSGGTYVSAMKGGYKYTGKEDMPTGSWVNSS